MSELCDTLGRPRPSLSPSVLSEGVFEEFQDGNDRASSEVEAAANVISVITGLKDRQCVSASDVPFYRLEKFDEELSAPMPDLYYGAQPAQINARIRRDLDEFIIPSNRTSLPAAPNFFFEAKGAAGRADVARRQAMYDGAVGARGILQLQNYGRNTPVHDGNAYTMSATYHPGTGTLQMYATHPRQSTMGETEYYMTQLDTYAMTGNINSFRSGAAAYRNARDWTQQKRDTFIADANAASLRVSAVSTSQTRSNAQAPSTVVEASFSSSETSADELALDHDISTKRQKSTPSQRTGGEV
ncbi:hypothetical protein B0A50_08486 [Salinomyces thailandicus]|uniref:DUF7924 domain-containing protein n=1 Tax=Salinomyces thailandicus TaxID=706561 RepID=A0A4U0TJH2_9PEZI|nr:hypothetical protein B0A50_08486 [Salinomyces thailandica]